MVTKGLIFFYMGYKKYYHSWGYEGSRLWIIFLYLIDLIAGSKRGQHNFHLLPGVKCACRTNDVFETKYCWQIVLFDILIRFWVLGATLVSIVTEHERKKQKNFKIIDGANPLTENFIRSRDLTTWSCWSLILSAIGMAARNGNPQRCQGNRQDVG